MSRRPDRQAPPTPSRQEDLAAFLPRDREGMAARGWDELDVLLVTGDGYVDHASFGGAAIGRLLEARGYRVGILDLPEVDGWDRLPAPRLFVGVTAGTIDSMVTNYTASRHRRKQDVYRPPGMPQRPNRATIAYTAEARRRFPGVPVVVGGLEAGPRRLAYFDYWEEKPRRSILVDSKADLLVWGMAERQVLEVAERLAAAGPDLDAKAALTGLRGTVEFAPKGYDEDAAADAGHRVLPSFEELVADEGLHLDAFNALREENRPSGAVLAQRAGTRWILQHPPHAPAPPEEVDGFFDLPYQRRAHPDHEARGGIQALEAVRFSINPHRGCMADCSFCSITFHQGRSIQSRSPESVLKEAAAIAGHHDFRGTITDVGGPTANMYGLGCKLLEKGEACLDRDCLTPEPCPALRLDTTSEGYRRLLALVRDTGGVKHAFVSSGIRYDMLRDKRGELLPLHHDIVRHHTSGRLKLAPEHASPAALEAMNKPDFDVYEEYEAEYKQQCAEEGRDQHLVNYFIVGHPGTTLADAVHLFEKLLERNYSPEQVQEFLPLPMTRAMVQYVTGRDPLTGKELFVPRGARMRRLQKSLVRWKDPVNRKDVETALREAGRADLLPRFRKAVGQGRGARRGRDRDREARPREVPYDAMD